MESSVCGDGESFYYLLMLFLLPTIFSFKPRFSLTLQGVISFIWLIFSVLLILNNFSYEISYKTNIPFLEFSYRIDSLSLFFASTVLLLASVVSVYSLTYINEFKNKRLLVLLYNIFIASMLLVIFSSNIPTFLIFWEIMSVVSFFLVIFDYKVKENLEAGISYIFMTHLGTGFIILAFTILFLYSSHLDFKSFSNINLPENMKFLVFLFALIGFGTKAGIFPLHIWLPKAHPVAPSNVSALMSGVMIKIAVYMLIRFYFEFLNNYPDYFGYIVVFIGSLSAIYGILYAYVQTDIKKLLAFSSMENIGIILMALGLSMIFKANNVYLLAGVAFIATLYHILNHSVFKGLLFLGAGSILYKTHTKNIENLGGLIKYMPKTAVFILFGVMGITALPPFNGFVSEWLIYQSILFSSKLDNEFLSFTMPLFASILALTGAFALGSFVKMFGLSFLGLPRTENVKHASESEISMLFAMGVLATLVVILGIFPFTVIYLADEVLKSLLGGSVFNSILYENGLILIASDYDFGRISPVGIALAGVLTLIIVYLFTRIFGSGKITVYETWACGLTEDNLTTKAQYSGSGFSQPIRRILAFVYKVKESLNNVEQKQKYFFPKKKYTIEIVDRVEYIYSKVLDLITGFILKVRYYIQPGIIHVYIAYIVITLTVLLLIAVR
ncbi:proton-conducting transporter membrane subunit [Sulfurihydrogenibium subterraneum]|uniref:proton-conducting transporter transmembrane domain-containing protein n=1 Tax=Sulfurihydrogenibium subterraneum TaxID=171121 RepID=UPI00055D4810|nr:proton-conducting transporter membrane subunit [Sulfurihydrogenibium subterraneum]